jgi:hypothetical protein
MAKTKERRTTMKNESPKDKSAEHFTSDLNELKQSFAKLRDDVTKVLGNALGTGKSGAANMKHRGAGSIERVEHKIGSKPLLSLVMAFVVGFILANLFTKRK